MRVLALDVSTKTGWAFFINGKPEAWGTVFPDKTVKDFGEYPMNFILLAEYLCQRLVKELYKYLDEADVIIIEETNSSKQNYSQKLLEYLHFALNKLLLVACCPVKYIRTGEWRNAVNAKQSAEEKKLNSQIARIKKKTGKKLAKIDGKVVGKKGRKHVALRVVNELLGIELKRKEEDAADALLLGLGYLRGAPVCDGTVMGGKSKKAA